jgi:hypothetical protein
MEDSEDIVNLLTENLCVILDHKSEVERLLRRAGFEPDTDDTGDIEALTGGKLNTFEPQELRLLIAQHWGNVT